MVKAYLRYELTSSWGVICSNSNVTYDISGKYLITSSLENVSLWNPKQGVLVSEGVVHARRAADVSTCQPGTPLVPHCCIPPFAWRTCALAFLKSLDISCLYSNNDGTGVQVKSLVPPVSQSGKIAGEVTQIAASPVASQIAVGHSDGVVSNSSTAGVHSDD